MYTTRDVYGNPRFIIHFLDLVHEDHPGDLDIPAIADRAKIRAADDPHRVQLLAQET